MIVYFIVLFIHSMTTRYSKVILTHYHHGPILANGIYNAKKCCIMQISALYSTSSFPYKMYDIPLQFVKNHHYLGILLDNKLSWTPHINSLCSKANRLLGFLRRTLHHCPSNLKEHAYKQIVLPSIEYCSSIWDPHQKSFIHKLDMIQHRAARRLCFK